VSTTTRGPRRSICASARGSKRRSMWTSIWSWRGGLPDRRLRARHAALILGGLILSIVAAGVGTAQRPAQGSRGSTPLHAPVGVLPAAYFILFEGLNAGRTPGKQALGIRVVMDTAGRDAHGRGGAQPGARAGLLLDADSPPCSPPSLNNSPQAPRDFARHGGVRDRPRSACCRPCPKWPRRAGGDCPPDLTEDEFACSTAS